MDCKQRQTGIMVTSSVVREDISPTRKLDSSNERREYRLNLVNATLLLSFAYSNSLLLLKICSFDSIYYIPLHQKVIKPLC